MGEKEGKRSQVINSKFESFIRIGDLKGLSIVDIITLQLLLSHKEPIVRHVLYLEVNKYIRQEEKSLEMIKLSEPERLFYESIEEKRDLSTASFYNNLENLERLGLINFNRTKEGKIKTVGPTQLTNSVLNTILAGLFNLRIEYIKKLYMNIKDFILSKLDKTQFSSILNVILSKNVQDTYLKSIRDISKEIFILTTDDLREILERMNLKNLKFSRVIKSNKIREPEDIFDLAIVPVYLKEPNFHNFTRIKILKELKRVVKPGGYVILLNGLEIAPSENIFMKELVDIYHYVFDEIIFTKKQIEDDIKEAIFPFCYKFENQ
jgi:SAM-dependent methyltransferase